MFRSDGTPLEYLAAFGASFAFGVASCLLCAWYGRYMRESGRTPADRASEKSMMGRGTVALESQLQEQ